MVFYLSGLSSSPLFYSFKLPLSLSIFLNQRLFSRQKEVILKRQPAASQCRNVKLEPGSTHKGYKNSLTDRKAENATLSSRVNKVRVESSHLGKPPQKNISFTSNFSFLLPAGEKKVINTNIS